MTIIVDASVAVKWFVEETLHDEARRLVEYQREIQAPDFILIEVANVAWKKAVRKEISNDQVRAIVRMIPQFIPLLVPLSTLLERATELAIELTHPIYDCLYIACAELTDAVLVTADARLCEAVAAGPYAAHVRHLSEVTA